MALGVSKGPIRTLRVPVKNHEANSTFQLAQPSLASTREPLGAVQRLLLLFLVVPSHPVP